MLKKKGKRFAAVLICFSMLGCMGVTSASAEWQWLTDWDDIPVGNTTTIDTTTPIGERAKTLYETEGWNYSEAKDAFDIQNKERERAGKEALAWSDDLYRLACARAKEMMNVGKVAHERPGDNLPLWESQPYGLGWVAENAGATGSHREDINERTASQYMIDQWMHSDGHRAALLESQYKAGAIACYSDGKGFVRWASLFALEESPKATSEIVIQNADGTTTSLPDDTILFQQTETAVVSSSTASE